MNNGQKLKTETVVHEKATSLFNLKLRRVVKFVIHFNLDTCNECNSFDYQGMYMSGDGVTDQQNIHSDPTHQDTENEEGQAVDPQQVMATEAIADNQQSQGDTTEDITGD